MITQKTAEHIWSCYREIATGEKLLADIEKRLGEVQSHDRDEPFLTDVFGREQHLQLGIPSGENSRQLIRVLPRLAVSVIRAHIADKKAELIKANEAARIELETP